MNAPSSSFGPGSRLGPYEIRSHLGSGAMGEVYLARDPRLGREVAIKVLPADRLTDVDRRRRFVAEARAASALNHPGIVTIHEIDTADGIDFIVMEYVAGQPLAALIPSQGMRLSDVLTLAIPMAEALARAHAVGIVHRDLKPANVMVGREGAVKILDFGLAKLVSPDGAVDERDTTTMDLVGEPASRAGRIAGTPAYMSPEQATGQKVDARSDVFSFGALLYEMVTGRRPFSGATTEETLAAVARDPPRAPSALVTGLPHDFEKLILRCLQKDPDRRFQSMLDLRVELREIQEELAAGAQPPSRRRRPWMAAMLVASVVAAFAVLQGWRRPALPAPQVVPLTSTPGNERDAEFSPDGEQIAFSWDGGQGREDEPTNLDIWVKLIGGSEVRRLTSDPRVDRFPAWSPDGKQIAFIRGGAYFTLSRRTIYVISPLGGTERKLADFPAVNAQMSWSPDSRWLATARSSRDAEVEPRPRGIYLLSAGDGAARALTAPEGQALDAQPAFSPDGRALAFARLHDETGARQDVLVLPLDQDSAVAGPPRVVARNVPSDGGLQPGLRWTRDGQWLVYGTVRAFVFRLERVRADGAGGPETVELAGRGACCPATVAGRDRLAFTQSRDNNDILRWYPDRAPAPILESSYADFNPSFSPDGRHIAFSSGRSGQQEVWIADADGANPRQFTRGAGYHRGLPIWSPDGRRLVYGMRNDEGRWDVWIIDADGANPRQLTFGPGDSRGYAFSPDGRFVYVSSNPEGRFAIWRLPVEGGRLERVTGDGARSAVVTLDGRTLLFDTPALMAKVLAGGAERQIAPCVQQRGFAATRVGVFYLECAPGRSQAPFHLVDLDTGKDRVIGHMPVSRLDPRFQGLSVSPDGSNVVFAKYVSEGDDLMMIDNFR